MNTEHYESTSLKFVALEVAVGVSTIHLFIDLWRGIIEVTLFPVSYVLGWKLLLKCMIYMLQIRCSKILEYIWEKEN